MSDELKPCPFCGGEAHQMKMGWPHRVYCEDCGATVTGKGFDGEGETDATVRWNARAAVTDEQFNIAVHDGGAWQRVRTCHMVPVSLYDEEGVDGIECDECGWSDIHEWYDPILSFCPNCGAKVIPC